MPLGLRNKFLLLGREPVHGFRNRVIKSYAIAGDHTTSQGLGIRIFQRADRQLEDIRLDLIHQGALGSAAYRQNMRAAPL